VWPEWRLAVAGQPRDPDSVRRAAHDILSQAQFRTAGPSLFDRARSWLGREISHALDAALAGHLGVVGVVVLLLIAAAVTFAVVRVARASRHGGRVPGYRVEGAARAPADWLAEAAACEARGDWTGALRARYRALVAELAARGVVDEVAGRTTGEYRAEVGANLPTAVLEFGGATDLFEAAVYGDQAAGPVETAELDALARCVLSGAR
jgi:hypothetical protein